MCCKGSNTTDVLQPHSPPSNIKKKFKSKFRANQYKTSNILVIEDDAVCAMMMLKYLDSSGIDSQIEDCGLKALDYLKANLKNIDVIIIDFNLPDLNGLQILHMINDLVKKDKIDKMPKIVFMSGSDLPRFANDLIKHNEYLFIQKPLGISDINNIINNRTNSKTIALNSIDYLPIENPVLIGRGSFAECYKCRFRNKTVVVKKCNYENEDKRHNLFDNKLEILKNIGGEINILKKIKHKYIINAFYALVGYDSTIIMMEYASNGDLFNKINEGLDSIQIKKILVQLCIALEYLHKKDIIHRDIKPENILVGGDGNIRVADFGFACYNSGKTICGTIDYIAPEIISSKTYNKSVDYWSIGILLYEMYHINTPFNNNLLREYSFKDVYFTEDFPEEARMVYNKLVELNYDKRIENYNGDLHNIKKEEYLKALDFEKILSGKCCIFT